MDISNFRDLRIAPRAVFDTLAERKDRPRFMIPQKDGSWVKVTWADFAAEIRDVAMFLVAKGLRPGDRVVVFAHNSVAWASAALGIQAAGGVMVPIYPASTAEQVAYVVRHSDARFAFAGDPAKLAGLPLEEVVVLSGESWQKMRAVGSAKDAEDETLFSRTMNGVPLDQPGMMLYTSGTSGNPKGVPLTHRNVTTNGLDWLECNAPILREDAVDVLWLPMSHIFGFGEMCLGNTLGFTTYLSDPQTVLARLSEVRPDVFMSVPSHWEKLAMLAHGNTDELLVVTGGRLSFCLSGGAGLKREVKELFHKAGILIIEGYGLTETSPTLTLNRPGAFRFDSVGKPIPSVTLKLADDGEILAKGPNVFSGYHKDEAATREAFTEDGWFKTGDVGRFTEDGFLQIIDRKKDILVTAGGKNIPPANIEIRFRDEPTFAHVVVYGEAKRYLVAGVWLSPDAEKLGEGALALVQACIDRVNSELPSYETIKRFAIMPRPLTVEDGLLTASLKVRRKKVNEAFRAEFEALYEVDTKPTTPEARP